MTTPIALAEAIRAYVIAPAGYRKTELITQAVALANSRQLVLTHTHAGVDALRTRMKKASVKSSLYHIETIAGFCLKLASSYPKTSGTQVEKPKKEDWELVYKAFNRLLDNQHIQDVLRLSYGGIYVDEYQDCTVQQHEIISKLSKILPCRLLGDPLQGIFDFQGSVLVDWDVHIKPSFNELTSLSTAWGWKKHKNDDLGEWLKTIRKSLEDRASIDLKNAPSTVSWIELPNDPALQISIPNNICLNAMNKKGSVIAIYNGFEDACHKVTRRLGGKYQAIETIECSDLMTFSSQIFNSTGLERTSSVLGRVMN